MAIANYDKKRNIVFSLPCTKLIQKESEVFKETDGTEVKLEDTWQYATVSQTKQLQDTCYSLLAYKTVKDENLIVNVDKDNIEDIKYSLCRTSLVKEGFQVYGNHQYERLESWRYAMDEIISWAGNQRDKPLAMVELKVVTQGFIVNERMENDSNEVADHFIDVRASSTHDGFSVKHDHNFREDRKED